MGGRELVPAALIATSWVLGHTWSAGWWRLAQRYAPWHIGVAVTMSYVVGPWGMLCLVGAVAVATWYHLAHLYP